MSEKPPPDFALLRAVEVLARIHDEQRRKPNAPLAAIDEPIVLRCPRMTIALAATRAQVERELGVAFSYPARGWHTYASVENGRRALLSIFYKQQAAVAIELYVPRTANAPALEAHGLGGFIVEPGGIMLGASADAIGAPFSPAVGGPAHIVYDNAFEARFPGGVAYAMTKSGVVERLTLYADLPAEA